MVRIIVGGPENYEIGVKGAYIYHFSGEGRLQSALKVLERINKASIYKIDAFNA